MKNTIKNKDLLNSLGLNDEQTKIIEYLINTKDVSVSELAKSLDLHRSSIYRYLDSLESNGWIQYILTNQGKNIRLADLSSLKWIIEEQKSNLAANEKKLDELICSAKSENNSLVSTPEVRYFEGIGGLRQTYYNLQNAQEDIRVLTSIVRRKLVGDRWLEKHLAEFSRKNIKARIIGDKEYAKYAYEEYKNREEYYGPSADLAFQFDERIYDKPNFRIKGEILIYDNIVASHSLEAGKIIGSEVVSEHLATTLKSVFDEVWKLTTEKDRIDNLIN